MIEDVDGVMVPAPEQHAVVAHDCLVVETDALSSVVSSFVADWQRRRPSTASQFTTGRRRATASSFIGPYDWLAQESGLTADRLRDIKRGSARRRYTPLREAEAIVVQALERPEMLTGSGALRVFPHPRGCCGGTRTSLTGV